MIGSTRTPSFSSRARRRRRPDGGPMTFLGMMSGWVAITGVTLVLGIGVAGCQGVSHHDPFAPSIVLIIENAGGATADIAILRDGGTERLGRIPPGEVRQFNVAPRGRSFTLRAEFAAGRRSARTVDARPGETFRYRIESDRLYRVGP